MTASDLRCSLVVVGYNSRSDLQLCLPSLLSSITERDEIILVDNASTDGTAVWVLETFPSIHVIRSDVNNGFGAGNNLAARHARGEYLAFINPDTTTDPKWLEALLRYLEADPSLGMVTSKILLMHAPDRINTCGNDIHISGLALCRGANCPADSFHAFQEVNAISGAAFAMRRSVFLDLGGFDETFFMYMEDTDLSLRALLSGMHIAYVPDSIVYHDYRLTFGPLKIYYQERNRYLCLLKNFSCGSLLRLAPVLFLAEMVTWGYCLFWDKNISNKLNAYRWVGDHWDVIMQARKDLQKKRRADERRTLRSFNYRLSFEQASGGFIPMLAHLVFDPFFFLCSLLV